jgi:hypothetical protein
VKSEEPACHASLDTQITWAEIHLISKTPAIVRDVNLPTGRMSGRRKEKIANISTANEMSHAN